MTSQTTPQSDTPQEVTPQQTRRPWLFVLLLLALMAGIVMAGRVIQGNPGHDQVDWRASYNSAVVEARDSGKPLLVVFGADWCGPCQQMKAQVYSDMKVTDTIETGFVPVHVDMTSDGLADQELANRYSVQGYPTMLILDTNGDVISESLGSMPKSDFLIWLERADSRYDVLNNSAARVDESPGG